MILDYVLSGLLLLVAVLNLIIYRNKNNLIKFFIGLFVSLLTLLFVFIPETTPFILYHEILCGVITIFYLLVFIPKKITKNLTEYDYFELEKNYNEIREEKELLRQRFLSTIDLIDEGLLFYENNCNQVIYSEFTHNIFGGKPQKSFKDHTESINSLDRKNYEGTISKALSKMQEYEIKYRLESDPNVWVVEKGALINAGKEKTIIATIRPITVSKFKKSTYFDVDALQEEGQMYSLVKDYIQMHKSFVFVQFELSNLPQINDQYSREIGGLMMNDFIRHFKNKYLTDITKLYRISGIRFVAIIDDLKNYQDFHKDLLTPNSSLYQLKVNLSAVKETIKPNFSIINVHDSTQISNLELMKLSTKLLIESKESRKRNYTIFNN